MGLPDAPKGGALSIAAGRQAAIATIDSILGNTENMKMFRQRLQELFEIDPIRFWQEIAMPLVPRSNNLDLEKDKGININIQVVSSSEEPLRKNVVSSTPTEDVIQIEG